MTSATPGRLRPVSHLNPLVVTVVACRTEAPPAHPAVRGAWERLPPLEPGWEIRTCQLCTGRVHVGARQLQRMIDDPDQFHVVLCMFCAAVHVGARVLDLSGQ